MPRICLQGESSFRSDCEIKKLRVESMKLALIKRRLFIFEQRKIAKNSFHWQHELIEIKRNPEKSS